MDSFISFFNRNWVRSLGNVLFRHYYPGYQRVDTKNVKVLKTDFGEFYFSNALQNYPNLFEQIAEYKIDDLKKDDVVLDIGANVGAFTVMVAPKVKDVMAIEPLFCKELYNNIRLNDLHNVRCQAAALGGGVSMNVSFNGTSEEVQCVDMFIIKEKLGFHPTFLKMDCEGGEWSLKPVDFDGIRAVEAEIHNFNNHDPMKFLQMLQEIGFDCDYYWTAEKQMMVHARR